MKEWPSSNIFLHRSIIKTDSFHKQAILIESPFDNNTQIWFPKAMIDRAKSNNPNYFSVLIFKSNYYRVYRYKGFDVCQIEEVRGAKLIEEYKKMKINNSNKFLKKQKELETQKTEMPKWLRTDPIEINYDEEESIVWD